MKALLALALVLQLTLPYAASAADDTTSPIWGPQIDYLALGDSLAAGMNENGQIGKGYTDFLAETLEDVGVLDFYTNDFAVSGYKTTDVLADITSNKKVTIDGVGELAIQPAIQDAELITLTMGANNLFQYIQKDETGKYAINVQAVLSEIKKIGTDYSTFFAEVKKLNPNAQIFVQGYYNSFPYEDAQYQTQLNALVNAVNNTIKTVVEAAGGVFVPTADLITSNLAAYLPNPKNVHLSEAGYEAVSVAFLEKLDSDFIWPLNSQATYEEIDPSTVMISWAGASDNVGVTGYNIYVNGTLVATVDSDVSTFKYNRLIPAVTYEFVIKAFDAAGNESYVNPFVSFETADRVIFKDITNHAAKNEIHHLAILGIMKGYSDNTFKPNGTVTRAQAAAIITRALNLTSSNKAPFSDIKKLSNAAQKEIAAAYEAGIIKGVNGKFKPNEPVTRIQFAIMLNRAYTILNNGTPYSSNEFAPFKDIARLNPEAKLAVTMLYEYEIVSGANGLFKPNAVTTRAAAAKMLDAFVPF